MNIEQQVRKFIIDNLRWFGPHSNLTPHYRLIDNDVLNSMAIFEMVAFMEGHFDIQIEDEDLIPENFETIQAIARLVSDKTTPI